MLFIIGNGFSGHENPEDAEPRAAPGASGGRQARLLHRRPNHQHLRAGRFIYLINIIRILLLLSSNSKTLS